MARMPGAELTFVEDAKLGYLLREEDKGGFFSRVGFSQEESEALRLALLEHARERPVVRTQETRFGIKYVLEGRLRSPDGRDPETRTVWIVERGRPRFLTAYPTGAEEEVER